MESFFARYRNLVVLLAILVAQIAGLATQVRRTTSGRNTLDAADPGGVRLIRLWANAVVSPPERLIHACKLGIVGTWTGYIDLRHVRQQNRDLQNAVDRLRLEEAALLEDARQGQRLQAMLGFQAKYIYTTLPAQAYGSSGSDRSHVFYIDKGASDGLKPDMAVITGDGIVGKVRDVFPHTAQVLAVNDSTSGAGVILETTRIRGILRGDATGQLEVVGIVADGRELLAAAGALGPDVIVLDISMPSLNGIEVARRVRKMTHPPRIVFLTMHDDATFATSAFQAGATGYVLKRSGPAEIITAIQEASRGRTYISPLVAGDVLTALLAMRDHPEDLKPELTSRQREILQLLAEGKSPKEIGAALHISARTVEFHKYRIMGATGVRTIAELTTYAITHGIIQPH